MISAYIFQANSIVIHVFAVHLAVVRSDYNTLMDLVNHEITYTRRLILSGPRIRISADHRNWNCRLLRVTSICIKPLTS